MPHLSPMLWIVTPIMVMITMYSMMMSLYQFQPMTWKI